MVEPEQILTPQQRRFRDLAVVGFGLTLCLLFVGGVMGMVNARRMAHHNEWVDHTRQVIVASEKLISTLKDIETGQRGFLLTEQESYLEPFHTGVARVADEVKNVRELTSDNDEQRSRLAELEKTVTMRVEVAKQTVDLLKKGNKEEALKIVRSDTGKRYMDELRRTVTAIEAEEQALLEKRAKEARASYRSVVWSVLINAILGLGMVSGLFYLIQRYLRAQHQAAARLFAQSEHLRVTLASIGDAVITTDAQGGVSNLNSVAEELTGWASQEAMGHPLTEVFNIVNEDTHLPVSNPAMRALEEGVITGLANHTILIAKDGLERPIDDSAAPIRSRRGEILGAVLVFRDITDRRRAETLLEDARNYAESIVDTVRESLVVLDGELRVRSVNRSFSQVFHVSAEQIQNRYLYDLGNGQWNIPQLRTMLRDVALENKKISDYEMEYSSPVYGQRVLMLNASRLYREGNHTEFILVAIEDITQRKRLENELRKYAADLSDSDRRKNEFLAMLAHELRNPLAPIRNALEIIRVTGGEGKMVASASEMMDRQLGQMVRLVDDLLDVSRISRGKIELRPRPVMLSTVIKQAVEATKSLYASMEHELSVSIPEEPVPVRGDPVRLTQVVGNLLNNACKFTDRGGKIQLELSRFGGEAVIRVKDNGIGIAADQLPRLFEMFMQVDTSLERSVSGLGIGLTLVKNLVELHGGSVEVQSAGLGQGSLFTVRLPIEESFESESTAGKPNQKVSAVAGRKILVVDDNQDSVGSLELLLKLTGNKTYTAYDGEQAYEAAERFRPEIVLLDLGLPKLNGYEVAKKIRSEEWGREMVIVALTGWGQEEDRRRSVEAGFDGHLVKPVDHNALMALLHEKLKSGSVRGGNG